MFVFLKGFYLCISDAIERLARIEDARQRESIKQPSIKSGFHNDSDAKKAFMDLVKESDTIKYTIKNN